jgi:hypothetical protein
METSEIKPASRRARVWARVSAPDKPPRRWWFPPSSRRDLVLHMPEAARQDYRQVVQQAHEKFSETVRLTMLALLGFALFCIMITFSTPDSALLVADPMVKLPFADIPVSFESFLLLGPLLLVVITLYLHIFYGYWLDLEADYQHLIRVCEQGEPPIERLPTLFSLDHLVPRFLTSFIFYWLVPLVLLTITWKAMARLSWGLPLALMSGLVTTILILLQIRRCPTSQRQRNRLYWAMMALIVGFMIVIPANAQRFQRPWNLFRADLKEKWLVGVNLIAADARYANFQNAKLVCADLRGANLRLADLYTADLWGINFQGANLSSAKLHGTNLGGDADCWVNLQDANLWGANLQDAYLQGAILWGANLQGAILKGTDLRGANLEGAHLEGAHLEGATLQDADLRGVDLRRVTGLTPAQLQAAHTDAHTQPPDDLQRPPP